MATRRIASSKIDWTAFSARIPKDQTAQFNAFRAKSASYVMKVSALPESAPAIDWSLYESRISIPGMVAEFKKQYESITVPFPADNYTAKVVEQEKIGATLVAEFVAECQMKMEEVKAERIRIANLLPISQMTLEEFYEAFPEEALDTFERPTMAPHTPEFQPEYCDQLEKEEMLAGEEH